MGVAELSDMVRLAHVQRIQFHTVTELCAKVCP